NLRRLVLGSRLANAAHGAHLAALAHGVVVRLPTFPEVPKEVHQVEHVIENLEDEIEDSRAAEDPPHNVDHDERNDEAEIDPEPAHPARIARIPVADAEAEHA